MMANKASDKAEDNNPTSSVENKTDAGDGSDTQHLCSTPIDDINIVITSWKREQKLGGLAEGKRCLMSSSIADEDECYIDTRQWQ